MTSNSLPCLYHIMPYIERIGVFFFSSILPGLTVLIWGMQMVICVDVFTV